MIRFAKLSNGCTLLESDTPPQVLNVTRYAEGWPVFKSYEIGEELEKETRKHLPEGYILGVGRLPDQHAYAINVWWDDPEKPVQGLEDVVIRLIIGHDALLYWFKTCKDWRLELVEHLQRDFDKRHG